MREHLRKLQLRSPLALLAGALILTGSGLALSRIIQAQEDSKATPVRLAVDDKPVNRDGRFTTSFAPVVKRVAPSVVNVFTTTTLKQSDYPQLPFFNDPFFRRFFGEDFDVQRPRRGTRAPKQRGLGSGVIVTKDGYILTNNHVVEKADEVKVALNSDGREYPAKVVGTDPKTDVAVLKIDASDLPAIDLANSDQIEVGDLVLAVGNPFGVGQTVTMGMISATGRAGMGVDLDYEDFIQTDAAINVGNSGGALIDAEGRLIGINTFILSSSGGNQGIGFAIPINLAKSVMESLIQNGRVIRGYLGVWLQDLNPSLAKQFDLEEKSGVIITDVIPGSPAEKAGLKNGDVVTELDSKPARDSRHLKLQVGQTEPGKKIRVKVLRDGKPRTIELTLKELTDNERPVRADRRTDQPSDETLEGVTVGDIDAAARRQWGIPANLRGALVMQVDPDSTAAEAGLQAGDVILEINRQPVRAAEDAVALTEKAKTRTSLLRVWSKGGTRYIVVDESKGR
ncbi:MAG: DegQ family serine endoprotease [Verrucomicrobia bacterium]|nr:DegQ family serine endoprotease [Verrucomicrobiota bacterium]